ncbi:hypothetical protein BP6252_09874 [Coleophoma cylindrospora]|uniref:Sfi1 spindle body domain-containing protein n=1 Tax=Coleophoma cylindrospora TaxID=1849047 RepID=A0A3D8QWV6_9HELO|nr:hypothetical protein BP6252_09874 [Coleophoma cylindrospora]
MPPSTSTAQSSRDAGTISTSAVEIYYTNEDVAILHSMVARAQALLPTLPERERLPTSALFGAYDEILPNIGVDADHDSRYARLLFKIGGLRGPGTLMDKFMEVMARMGIEIEFDLPQTGSSDPPDSQSEEETQVAVSEYEKADTERPRSRGRRNSESSMWVPPTPHPTADKHGRRRSFSSHGGVNNDVQERLVPLSETQSRLRLSTKQRPSKLERNVEDARKDIRTWLRAGLAQASRGRMRSTSTQSGMRIRRRSLSVTPRDHGTATSRSVVASDDYHAATEDTVPTSDAGQGSASDSEADLYERGVHAQTHSRLEVKASLIYTHRLAIKLKTQIMVWRDKAMQLREHNYRLNLIAVHRDGYILIRAAFEGWHQHIKVKKYIAETESFFGHLERRAGRARDLFLLHKAFTHWAQCAIDEAQRTSVARRHIVRVRVFNAWREITAVNELKVRRHVLKRFFGIWKRQNYNVQADNRAAMQKYENNLVGRIYWDWFFKFCDINAKIWHNNRTKQRVFLQWFYAAQGHKSQKEHSLQTRRQHLLRDAWHCWQVKTEQNARRHGDAEIFYQTQLCRSALRKWRHEERVIPARVIVQTDVSIRLLRDKFSIWLLRARQEKQAANADRLKIMREALVTWRLKLRSQAVSSRIDDRIALQVLYKWVLVERLSLLQRVRDRRLMQNCIASLVQGWGQAREMRWDREDLANLFLTQRAQKMALNCWRSRRDEQQELDATAMQFRAPRLLHVHISTWNQHAQQVQLLGQWATDARYYFLVSRALRIWKSGTEKTKRDKRKLAYAQLRRLTKVNLARRTFQLWHKQAKQVLILEAHGAEVSTNRTVIRGMEVFDRWRGRAEEIAEMENICRESILRKFLLMWREHLVSYQAMQSEAVLSFQERTQDRSLKRWSLRTLKERAQSNYALDVREKNAKKNFRRMFVYWQTKTTERRPRMPPQFGDTARAEAWSEFGDDVDVDVLARDLEETNSSTFIPGYLSTPSKRTERVLAAAARFSSTTPRAPLSTPFERQLRAQYSGGTLPSMRRPPGRSTIGIGGGFSDIPRDKDGGYRRT